MGLKIYRVLLVLLSPFIMLFIALRVLRGREDPHHFGERFGHASAPRPTGHLVWVHGASVGETVSTFTVLKHLRTMRPEVNLLLTTGTRTGHAMLHKLAPGLPGTGAIHIQYAPLDFTSAVARFFAHWQPTLSVFVESDFWPNLLTSAPRPVLLNGRISDRSWRRYRKYRWFFRPLLSRFEAALAQRETDVKRLKKMGAKHVHSAGNLKFDAEPLGHDAEALDKLKTAIGKRPVLVFASTHQGEEEQAAQLHTSLKTAVPELLTIIIPRHPHRGTQALGDVQRHVRHVARRGLGELPTTSPKYTDVYLADTLGELGLFYRLANVAVVGGSLVPHGGHNPLEPLKLGTLTLAGPHMFNFKDMLPALTDSGALIVAKNNPDLAKKLHQLLTDPAAAKAQKQVIQAVLPKLAGASRTAAALLAAQLPAR